jgi:hypothetical protein
MSEKRRAPFEADTTRQIVVARNELDEALAANKATTERLHSSIPPSDPDDESLIEDEDTHRFSHRKRS